MPVPDQVRDDVSGIQNILELMDSGFRQNDKPGIKATFCEVIFSFPGQKVSQLGHKKYPEELGHSAREGADNPLKNGDELRTLPVKYLGDQAAALVAREPNRNPANMGVFPPAARFPSWQGTNSPSRCEEWHQARARSAARAVRASQIGPRVKASAPWDSNNPAPAEPAAVSAIKK